MGLDFVGSEAHWSYSGFHRFRCRLAKEIGIDLDMMEGFVNYGGNLWKDIKDPIKLLLTHSDCEGILTPESCKTIAPRLRELIKNWDDNDYDKKQALLLAEGMEMCAEENTTLKFS